MRVLVTSGAGFIGSHMLRTSQHAPERPGDGKHLLAAIEKLRDAG